MRMLFIYFNSKQKKMNYQKQKKRDDHIDKIKSIYEDLKLHAMILQDDTFVPIQFMQYAIRQLLKMRPNQNFINFIQDFIVQCEFSENAQSKITFKIKQVSKTQQAKTLHLPQKKIVSESHFNQNSIDLQLANRKDENVGQSQNTPFKKKNDAKLQGNTHQSSQKKENVILKQENEQSSLDCLKRSLKMHKRITTPHKQRTLYLRSKYLIPKKQNLVSDQISSTGSNNNEQMCLIQFNRSFSSRCIPMIQKQEQDFLVGATPKPKKKLKMEKTYTGNFDKNGDFVRGF